MKKIFSTNPILHLNEKEALDFTKKDNVEESILSLYELTKNIVFVTVGDANKKIEELDTRRQTISKAIAELSVETISPQQIKKLSYYLDNWDSIDFDDKRKAADGLISTIKATSDRVQIEWKI